MDNITNLLNQAANYGTEELHKVAKLIINAWNNNIIPALAKGDVIPQNIAGRTVSSVKEVMQQAGHLAMPLTKLLANRMVDLTKSASPLTSAQLHVAITLAVVVVVIPTIREYCAAGENRGIIKAIPVIAWMIITRPFRLAYRILTVITGGTEVDRQNLKKAQAMVGQIKNFAPAIDKDLTDKQVAVDNAITAIADANTKGAFVTAFGKLKARIDGIVRNGSFKDDDLTQWNFLQLTLKDHANLRQVKSALDQWKKCLDLKIMVK
ncbi:MAG: hypothetical protein LBB16_00230 [Puniceicoccales bacterium]|jgi:hypothetical protein|nr:hypothetical protein [Puniceicoccales bacterium]